MHEVIGHASGKIADRLNGKPQNALKEQYSALEEARADLVALYFLPDPKLEELGLVSAADHDGGRPGRVRSADPQRARAVAPRPHRHADRRRSHAQPPDDRPLADEEHEGDRDARQRDGKTYYVVVDAQGVSRRRRDGCSPKSSASSRKATIRRPGSCSKPTAMHFDPKLRDEIVARVDHLNLPSYTGFVMPRLEAVDRRQRRDHRREDLVPARPDHADAGVFGGDAAASLSRMRQGCCAFRRTLAVRRDQLRA